MVSVMKRFCLALIKALLAASLLRVHGSIMLAQTSPQLSPQEESIRRQFDSIKATAINAQATSIRAQAEAVRKQYGVVTANSSPVFTEPPVVANLPPAPDKKAANPTTADAQQAAGAVVASAGFYTVPWPKPDGFSMPDVQVFTNGCAALDANEVNALVETASKKNGVNATLLRGMMQQESAFRPCAMSTAGAMGLMQIMPETADELGLTDPFDPAANVDAGARYMKQMLDKYNGNTALALAAYNAGPGRTDKARGIPPIMETIDYVSRIMSGIPLF
jgi:soluble lytic murein transglycosylase-like protein